MANASEISRAEVKANHARKVVIDIQDKLNAKKPQTAEDSHGSLKK